MKSAASLQLSMRRFMIVTTVLKEQCSAFMNPIRTSGYGEKYQGRTRYLPTEIHSMFFMRVTSSSFLHLPPELPRPPPADSTSAPLDDRPCAELLNFCEAYVKHLVNI